MEDVPALGLDAELRALFDTFGEISAARPLDELPTPDGTEAHWFQYTRIAEARYQQGLGD